MSKDWTGNTNSVFKNLASSHHSDTDRQISDYYATEPRAVELLLKLEKFNHNIWEPACGEGHISKVLESAGYKVYSSDFYDRGFGEGGIDFLNNFYDRQWDGDIITNPPYRMAKEFIEKALDVVNEGHKVAMFLKVTFMEGKGRKRLFTNTPPPYNICIIFKA